MDGITTVRVAMCTDATRWAGIGQSAVDGGGGGRGGVRAEDCEESGLDRNTETRIGTVASVSWIASGGVIATTIFDLRNLFLSSSFSVDFSRTRGW